ncbi:transposon Ty3-I Gag-Pol polyprotein [Trichonephila clavipes]|nr:transposon Ty3-I Gag-Pol polyprotein [Trichonephila clavipes]
MAHVDAFSRPPHCMLIQNSVHLQFLKAQQADDQITAIKTLLETTPHDNYIFYGRCRSHKSIRKPKTCLRKNPARIITDKGSAFTSFAFEDYCKKQNILHISITTGLPRSNGQIEKQNSTIIAVLSKLSVGDPNKWYSHVPHLQEILNSTFQKSFKMTPFELIFGTKMKSCQDIEIVELFNDEITAQFQEQRDARRQDAKKQIYKVQDENHRTYNLRRRQAHKYQLHDLVAIKRNEFGPGLKLKEKYLGPYKVTKVKHNDTYDVEKCDFVDGPSKTSTCAEFTKLWLSQTNSA